MTAAKSFGANNLKAIISAALIVTCYWLARQPVLSNVERVHLASQYHFTRQALPELPGNTKSHLRPVNPSLNNIAAWISAVGASVALSDLDGDGLPNDISQVETTTNQVIISPAPGTPERYHPFSLNPAPLPYDPETMAPMGSLAGDFNEDGLTDILVYFWGRTPVLFVRNAPAASGTTMPLSDISYNKYELVPDVERWYTNAVTQADLDGDGHIDLVIGNYFPDGARVLDSKAAIDDQMQHSMSRAGNGGRNRFLLWSGPPASDQSTGTTPAVPAFRSIEGVLGNDVLCGWTLAVGAADLDGDLLPEIYFANDFGPDNLLHNLSRPGELRFRVLAGEKGFTTPNSKVLGRDSFKGMGIDFADLNGDGLLDIAVSNIAAEYALEESHFVWISTGHPERMKDGIAPYTDRGEDLGLSRSNWSWDIRFGDYNNDGVSEVIQATGFLKGETNRWPELHELAMTNDQLLQKPASWPRFKPGDDLGGHTHTMFFTRGADGRYYDISSDIGLGDFEVSRGVATADVDGDGRLDFAVANQWETSFFYHNESLDIGNFLGLKLLMPVAEGRREAYLNTKEHTGGNALSRPAIGATATVYLPDGRKLVGQVDGGSGHSGKRSQDLHFGLGKIPADAQLKVEIRWRTPEQGVMVKTLILSPGWRTVMLGQ